MKSRVYIFIILVFVSGFALAQTNSHIINTIDSKVRQSERDILKFDSVSTDILGQSTDNGKLTAYFDKSQIKMIKAAWFGESGRKEVTYYYDSGNLIEVTTFDFQYNRPYYWDAKHALENGDNETFDISKTKIFKNQYYFTNSKLILWLDNNGHEIPFSNKPYLEKEIELLCGSIELQKKLSQ